jgi:hypothetical protein
LWVRSPFAAGVERHRLLMDVAKSGSPALSV